MKDSFGGIYKGLKVLVTGHTGFKGSWLALWLKALGATVVGYSLKPPTNPNLYTCSTIEDRICHIEGDILDLPHFSETLQKEAPDIIFHLAAQSLVLNSYVNPLDTFNSNTQGTVHVLDSSIKCPSLKALVLITTDKVYENTGQVWGYREIDPLGGSDPYSASKAMAEIAIDSYRKSFADLNKMGIASARAGNVIGGGDFSDHRLIPDAMKALMHNQPIFIRHPHSIRPWMHVLDPLSGYLWLGYCLLNQPKKFSQAWNFAPTETRGISCQEMIEKTITLWGKGEWIDAREQVTPTEMQYLRLNGEKTEHLLKWRPSYNWVQAIKTTVDWYQGFSGNTNVYDLCIEQIKSYTETSKDRGYLWAT